MEPGTARQIIQIVCVGEAIRACEHIYKVLKVLNVFFSATRGTDQHLNHSICQPEHVILPPVDNLPIVIHLVGKFSIVQVQTASLQCVLSSLCYGISPCYGVTHVMVPWSVRGSQCYYAGFTRLLDRHLWENAHLTPVVL